MGVRAEPAPPSTGPHLAVGLFSVESINMIALKESKRAQGNVLPFPAGGCFFKLKKTIVISSAMSQASIMR
jgi:hypothetical protein